MTSCVVGDGLLLTGLIMPYSPQNCHSLDVVSFGKQLSVNPRHLCMSKSIASAVFDGLAIWAQKQEYMVYGYKICQWVYFFTVGWLYTGHILTDKSDISYIISVRHYYSSVSWLFFPAPWWVTGSSLFACCGVSKYWTLAFPRVIRPERSVLGGSVCAYNGIQWNWMTFVLQ